MPVFLTSLSTVIGFLSLNFSDVPPFNHLGNITAVGVTAAFLLSVTLLPALIAILPIRSKTTERKESLFMEKLADFVIRFRKPLLAGTSAIILVFVALVPLNELDDRFVEYFDTRIDFRNHTDFTSEELTGIYQVEYSISGGESGSICNPESLERLEAYSNWLRAQDGVEHVGAAPLL